MNITATFIHRPVATTLLTIGVTLVGVPDQRRGDVGVQIGAETLEPIFGHRAHLLEQLF